MPLILHHLRVSQSERILWLLEELGVEYTLRCYDRNPIFAPPELKSLPGNHLGTAPVLQDGDDESAPTVTLSESGAIAEYLLAKYGRGSGLAVDFQDPTYPQYLYWLHAAYGTFQPVLARLMVLNQAGVSSDNTLLRAFEDRLQQYLGLMDKRLAETGAYLVGANVTAADTMSFYCLTTFRYFYLYSLADYPNILAYTRRVGDRTAYQQAMKKGNPDMELVLGPAPPAKTLFESATK